MIFKKVNVGGFCYWRKLLISITKNDAFIVTSFYSRTFNKMKTKNEFSFTAFVDSKAKLNSVAKSYLKTGYIVFEHLQTELGFKSLRFFKPPRINLLTGEKLHNQFIFDQQQIGFPIKGGTRVYVQLANWGEVNVKAIDEFGHHFIIPSNIQGAISAAFTQFESMIIEGYIDNQHLLITDLVSTGGLCCELDLNSRLEILINLNIDSPNLSLCEPVLIDKTFLDERSIHRDPSVRFYVIKAPRKRFEQADPYRGTTFMLPNFYSLMMSVIRPVKLGTNNYNVALFENYKQLAIGNIVTNRPLTCSQQVVVNFSEIKNGVIENAWLADWDLYRNKLFEESIEDALISISECWASRQNSEIDLRKTDFIWPEFQW
ncbi:MAG: hypothetical protein ACJASG_000042 [Oleiphilaceae bacterium]|jgi:hypothetical protein